MERCHTGMDCDVSGGACLAQYYDQVVRLE